MRSHHWLAITVLVAASMPSAAALPAREGKHVYAAACSGCHAQGRDGAPRVGDQKAWAQLSERGLTSLTGSAIAGVRKMPPHGGKFGVSDLEVKRAIAYMVNQSGGRWVEPIDPVRPPRARSGDEIVKANCLECHGEGRNGAPRLGDNRAWADRAKRGFDPLVQSALRGHGGMPARGGMGSLTEWETRAAVAYLLETSLK